MRCAAVILLCLCAAPPVSDSNAQSHIFKITRSIDGKPLDGPSRAPSVSANGRYTVFESEASNLSTEDGAVCRKELNFFSCSDVFLFDRDSSTTELISKSSANIEGNNHSSEAAISASGRWVAFTSTASNLAPGMRGIVQDVFLRDRTAATTILVSRSPEGRSGDKDSGALSVSDDGRFVAFASMATNLDLDYPGGTQRPSIYVYNRTTGLVGFVNRGQAGSISADGRFVVAADSVPDGAGATVDTLLARYDIMTIGFDRISIAREEPSPGNQSGWPDGSSAAHYASFQSSGSDLVENDDNETLDIFVYDWNTNLYSRVSLSSGGEEANGPSRSSAISADGRFVVFESDASNLVPNDANGLTDIFLHDRSDGSTVRVSVPGADLEANHNSQHPAISADGRWVAFASQAANLVPGDSNNESEIFLVDTTLLPRADPAPQGSPVPRVINDAPEISFQVQSNGKFTLTLQMPRYDGIDSTWRKRLWKKALRAARQPKLKLSYLAEIKPAAVRQLEAARARKRKRTQRSKKNKVSFRQTASGSYSARYRIYITHKGRVIGKTGWSPTVVVELAAP